MVKNEWCVIGYVDNADWGKVTDRLLVVFPTEKIEFGLHGSRQKALSVELGHEMRAREIIISDASLSHLIRLVENVDAHRMTPPPPPSK